MSHRGNGARVPGPKRLCALNDPVRCFGRASRAGVLITGLLISGVLVGAAAIAPAQSGENADTGRSGLADPALSAAARELGCEAKATRALKTPHDGVVEIRCRDGLIIWMHQVDGRWTIHPIG